MSQTKEVQEEVLKAVEAADTPPAESTKEVPAPAVNTEVSKGEVPQEPVKVDVVKLQEQVSNLNTALSQERNEKKQDKEKISALEKKLEESMGLMDRMKGIFVPQEEPIQTQPNPLTEDKLIQILEEREQRKQQETEEQKRSQIIQDEIKDLESYYSGKDGGLKYDDQEVLKWQKDNNKLYLTPKEAFAAMKQKEIIDYEVKLALSGKKPVENVETPGGTPVQHEPAEVIPKNDQEMRQAVLEAMEILDKEL